MYVLLCCCWWGCTRREREKMCCQMSISLLRDTTQRTHSKWFVLQLLIVQYQHQWSHERSHGYFWLVYCFTAWNSSCYFIQFVVCQLNLLFWINTMIPEPKPKPEPEPLILCHVSSIAISLNSVCMQLYCTQYLHSVLHSIAAQYELNWKSKLNILWSHKSHSLIYTQATKRCYFSIFYILVLKLQQEEYTPQCKQ